MDKQKNDIIEIAKKIQFFAGLFWGFFLSWLSGLFLSVDIANSVMVICSLVCLFAIAKLERM